MVVPIVFEGRFHCGFGRLSGPGRPEVFGRQEPLPTIARDAPVEKKWSLHIGGEGEGDARLRRANCYRKLVPVIEGVQCHRSRRRFTARQRLCCHGRGSDAWAGWQGNMVVAALITFPAGRLRIEEHEVQRAEPPCPLESYGHEPVAKGRIHRLNTWRRAGRPRSLRRSLPRTSADRYRAPVQNARRTVLLLD